jgi:hypothetical protein
MNQLIGTIKSITPRRGFRPSLDIQLEISAPGEDQPIAFTWMLARVAISFSPSTKAMPARGDARDFGIAVPRYTLPSFNKTTTTNFTLPLDDRLIEDLEKERNGTNVFVYLSVTFNAIINSRPAAAGLQQQPIDGAIADPNYGGQDVVRVVPKSEWEEIIHGLHISDIDSQRKLEEYEVRGRQKLKELEATLKSAKEAAELLGIVEHAKFFEDEARNHKRSANWWLTFTILLAVLASVAAGFNFIKAEQLVAQAISQKANGGNLKPTDAKPEGFVGLEIQMTIAKLIILSILLSAGIWAGRVYKAHRHNFIINRHRRNALSTFQTFATGTSDPQIKNAVLLQATTCIFGPQSTGYINQEKETETYPQILEIIRGVGSARKSE